MDRVINIIQRLEDNHREKYDSLSEEDVVK